MIFRRHKPKLNRRQRLSDDQDQAKISNSFSSYSQGRQAKANLATDTHTEKLGHFWLQRVGLLVFLVAATASAVNILSLTPSAKVLPLATSDSQPFLRPTNNYEAVANQLLTASIWNRSKLTIDASGISQQLLQRFPELTNVSITVPLLAHRPLVYIEPAQPALVLGAGNGSYVVDASGKALLKINNSTRVPKDLPTLTDQGGLKVQLNHQALPVGSVKFIRVVLAELTAKQFTPSSLVLPAASSELDVHLAGHPYFIKFNLGNYDPRGQAGTFLAAVAGLKRQSITPAQYVDVRVDGRAYYQ